MNVLFEEDGAFKAGAVLADNNTSLQVELPTGKRSKVKSANVLLRFSTPGAAELLERAESEAAGIDSDFLWEVCGDAEFGFEDMAREYAGHAPDAVEAAAVLLRLHSAPVYFHRKGRGRYRKAPPEILQAALAGLEKKRQQVLAIERLSGELQAGRLPEELRPLLRQLLYKPDRNRLETKAFEAACAASGLSPVQLLARCGALSSIHDYHLDRFLFEYFPQGEKFAADLPPAMLADLPQAPVRAFSIDDAQTTEIDDAFSVVPLAADEGGGWRIGIHIAAPGLGIRPDDELGRLARNRLSTVYMPGRKITMLPEAVVERYTLLAGRSNPALSVYLDVAADFSIRRRETRIEAVAVAANLRHHDMEPLFNEETLAGGLPDFDFRDELRLLWEFATALQVGRGKAGQTQNQTDYNYVVDWSADSSPEPGRIRIERRKRGSPLDTLVAELMIAANAGWGRDLADAGVAALYRAQTAGKVRMTTVAAAHEGLGVDCYTWTTSPLRRHVDLLNQWQLIAWLRGEPPPFAARSIELLSAMRDFELTYAAYGEFQRGMERYWCLRWLQQENLQEATAHVLREGLVRLEAVPLVLRMPGLPTLDYGTRIRLVIETIDLYEPTARARFIEALPDAPLLSLPADDGAVEILAQPAAAGPPVATADASAGEAGAGAG
ncbi:Ribonuclease II [Sterolibacterium denitrificans]|uniref:Ribonuclease II n=1 Tax=Sterolibacterium denitrificans TaxID=157592 RepID=A0A7Z7MTX4_9PROT|nr:RNB domain-containing ribonuclease [Sterolibacterium denitrificans]SMB21056.1 Ribonuclease II [Sterolibacterium denitrificans]